ncbi:hypothetical protein [Halobacterium sp. BOL4-2]|uniref:hypothetical protein n=1 Tax=Halobacterium sp. BOL4-2 TaxID=2810537 RepID=UPI001E52EFA5|nr:hypothetical protein [Halobacterium sp. BOL4-2]
MNRRTVLSGAAAVISAGLAGCSTSTTQQLPSAVRREEPIDRPFSTPVVGENKTTAGADQNGVVELRVHVHKTPELLMLVSIFQLNPGESYESNGWKSTGFNVEHRWGGTRYDGEGGLSRRATLVQAPTDDAETPYRMATTDDSARHVWQVRCQTPMVSATTDIFVTEFPVPESAQWGDTFTVKVHAEFSNEQQKDRVWCELPVTYSPSES